MRITKAYRKSDNRVVADPCFVADGAFDRVLGLMGESNLDKGAGLLIVPCNSVHTYFMRFPLDLVFMDRDGKVLAVKREVKPWRMTWPVWRAHSVLEVAAGTCGDIREGEQLCLS